MREWRSRDRLPTNQAVEALKLAQEKDELCKEVVRCCQEGWPTYKTDAYTAIHPYWEVKAHLTVMNGVLLYDSRIVVPTSERLNILDRIHQAHQGIVKCRLRARRSVWWPRMSTQIQEMVQNCRVCRLTSDTPIEPLCPSTLPERPWERLGADLFEFQKSHYLLIIDYYSRWIEVRKLPSLTSSDTIEAFKSVFATHGIGEVVISDNGPQFSSGEFQKFVQDYGFVHMTSSPCYPRANGEAERAVGTLKRMWKTSDPHLSLLTYRATPLENGYTPSELLMGRLIQTTLPTLTDNLLQKVTARSQIEEFESDKRQYTKAVHDQNRAKELPELHSRDNVYIRDMQREGTVIKMVAPRSYSIQTENGVIRRNRSALIDVQPEAKTSQQNLSEGLFAEGHGQCQATPKASRVPCSPDTTSGAEGRTNCYSPHASPSECRGSKSDVAEGTDARHADLDHGYSRPQRLKKKPLYLEDYDTSG